MRAHTLLRMAATGVATLLIGTTGLWAFCDSSIETYALFQCAEQAYFAPVPAPYTPGEITAVFWQVGFGNDTLNTGDGTLGTGVRSKKYFNGNDSGTFLVDLPDAATAFPGIGFPAGSVCLGSNNWANAGIDGCCDNPRLSAPFLYYNQYNYFGYYQYYYGGYFYASDDNILNPYYGTYVASTGRPSFYSLGSMMDYPTAVLLKTPDQKFFAIAAVTNMDRGNDGSSSNGATGDPNTAGTNPGPDDIRQGFYSFADVTNGTANVITGLNNVIPWQSTPEPSVDANSIGGDPNDPNATLTFDISWSAPVIHSDQRSVPSNNPTMAPADPNSADGPGVVDIGTKFGLVRYQFEFAAENDPGFTTIIKTVTCPGDAECNTATTATLQCLSTECVRINTLFGTPPRETVTTNATNCRLGKCGDLGYGVISDRFCPGSATCFPSPEICDGLDNDCDGVPDNGFNIGQACDGVGECGAGLFECDPVDPNFAICSTDPGGSGDQSGSEFCDGLDNDCDASTDEDFTTLGDACTGTGECANDPNGVTECSAADPNATQCSTDPGGSNDQSTQELCDALDNDCDASTDEDFSLGQACTGTGECGAGVLECSSDPNFAQCSTDPNGSADQSTAELCDSLDNDCDASTDEDFSVGQACTGTGECGAGTLECSDPNNAICSSDPGGSGDQSVPEVCGNQLDDDCDAATDETGGPEFCDGIDNNCDGQTDEGFSVGDACSGVGECGAGILECSSDPNFAQCSTDPGGSGDESVAELCDDLDNDCDASTDEDFNTGQACSGTGECGAGTLECSDPNNAICSTDPGGSGDESVVELCDGLDNDCDASTDEDFGIGQICTGVGECGDGQFECVDPNSAMCSTDPGGSQDGSIPETCDALDNDCDGSTDEGGICIAQFLILDPNNGDIMDCSDPKAEVPRIIWDRASFDRFRPQIAWDPSFAKKKRIQSYVALTTGFWEPNGRKWKKACKKAFKENPGNPTLYIRVKGKDLDVPQNDPFRDAITPTVTVTTAY